MPFTLLRCCVSEIFRFKINNNILNLEEENSGHPGLMFFLVIPVSSTVSLEFMVVIFNLISP